MKHLSCLALGLTLAASGCTKEKPAEAVKAAPAFKASCNTPTMGVCTEYTEAAFILGEELVKTGCTETKGSWGPAKCPTEKRLGTCVSAGMSRLYYPGGSFEYSKDTASKDCTELVSGQWVASR
jgi:hypothetical protein